MSDLNSSTERFPHREARQIIEDLLVPSPWIYWVDFTASAVVGWGAFMLAVAQPDLSAGQAVAILISALALYRAVIFTHELAHLRRKELPHFRLVWNLTCGMPLMAPSFTYRGVHDDHHKGSVYGRRRDGEYVPFGAQPRYRMIGYLLLPLVLPLLFAARFIVLAPLSLLHPRLRELLWTRASSLAIDLSYRRPEVSVRDDPSWRIQELGAFAYGALAIAPVVAGILPREVLVLWYVVAVVIFFLNSLRTLAAHRYLNTDDEPMTATAQYLDSVNVPGSCFVTGLWAPVGLRYHATHHLCPGIPYHHLGAAHRRLASRLSDSSLYLAASRRSLWDALSRLFADARIAEVRSAGRYPGGAASI